MFKRRSSIIIVVFLWSWAGLAAAADWQCAVDLNGDGCACDADESSSCVATDTGSRMCPIGLQDCLPKYEPPVITSVPATYEWKNWFAYSTSCTSVLSYVLCSESFNLDTNGDGQYDSSSTGSNHPPVLFGSPWEQGDFRALADSYLSNYEAFYNVSSTNVRVLSGSESYSRSFISKRYQYAIAYERLYGPSCPGGGTYNPATGMCDSEPVCSVGTLTQDNTQCFLGNSICPSGNYACEPVGGVNKCSPNACTDLAAVPPDTANPTYPGYTDNGNVGNDGSCSGVILLFNGKGGECRPPGANTAYRDCCKFGGGDPSWLNFCKETEATAVQARDAGRSHFVEEYCKTRWKFGVGSICVQRARYYCLFNSKLGRIIQEQGRKQLKVFQPNGAWGDHNAPNCRGLSPQEFQMIDFSKADLSEFVSSINSTVSTAIQQQMNESVNQFMNTLQ